MRSSRSRIYRWLFALMLVGAITAAVLRAPSAIADFTSAFEHLRVTRLPWLLAALGAELVSFVAYAWLQAVLLRAGAERVRITTLLRLSIASSGLRDLLPAGVVPSSGWLLAEYRRLGVTSALALYVVLASGFVATVTILAMLLVAASIAGVISLALLIASAVVLVGGSIGFVALIHRLSGATRPRSRRRGRLAHLLERVVDVAVEVGQFRSGFREGGFAFAASFGNWAADLVCLIAAFAMLGVSVPWRALLFGYSAAQLAGSIFPLPGGLGAVEGGLVGAFDATGVPAGSALAVALVYRIITYWVVAAMGGLELVFLARRPPEPAEHLPKTRDRKPRSARRHRAAKPATSRQSRGSGETRPRTRA